MVSVFWGAFALSLFGSIHCMGMCGGFALLARGSSTSVFSKSLLAYLVGKTAAYTAFGAVFGFFGGTIHKTPWGSNVLAVIVGLAMIWIGLEMAGFNPMTASKREDSWWNRFSFGRLVNWLQSAAARKGVKHRLVLGVLNGLLPCGLLYAAFVGAAQTGDPIEGAAFMMVFGLGTFPSLIVAANIVNLLSKQNRLRLSHVTGWLILAYGLVTLIRGTGVMGAMMH